PVTLSMASSLTARCPSNSVARTMLSSPHCTDPALLTRTPGCPRGPLHRTPHHPLHEHAHHLPAIPGACLSVAERLATGRRGRSRVRHAVVGEHSAAKRLFCARGADRRCADTGQADPHVDDPGAHFIELQPDPGADQRRVNLPQPMLGVRRAAPRGGWREKDRSQYLGVTQVDLHIVPEERLDWDLTLPVRSGDENSGAECDQRG